MTTDTMIRTEGTKILIDALGLQSATRFFTLIQREPFDYTKWQENLMEDMSVKEISDRAVKYRQTNVSSQGYSIDDAEKLLAE